MYHQPVVLTSAMRLILQTVTTKQKQTIIHLGNCTFENFFSINLSLFFFSSYQLRQRSKLLNTLYLMFIGVLESRYRSFPKATEKSLGPVSIIVMHTEELSRQIHMGEYTWHGSGPTHFSTPSEIFSQISIFFCICMIVSCYSLYLKMMLEVILSSCNVSLVCSPSSFQGNCTCSIVSLPTIKKGQ